MITKIITMVLLAVVLALGVILGLNWAGVFGRPLGHLAIDSQESPLPKGTNHTVWITAYDTAGKRMSGVPVRLEIGGTNRKVTPTVTTGADGRASYTYHGQQVGIDSITATADGYTATARCQWVEPASKLAPASSSTGANGTIFKDDFSNPNSGWNVDSRTNEYDVRYYNSSYRMIIKKPNWYFLSRRVNLSGVANYAVEVDARSSLPQVTDAGYGIIFGSVDKDNMYAFLVLPSSGKGFYRISRLSGGKWKHLTDWTYSPSIHTGTETNRLKIVCKGTEIFAYANGFHLATVKESALTAGYAGLTVESGESGWADVFFDNFEVRSM